jgi:hypothetical protein
LSRDDLSSKSGRAKPLWGRVHKGGGYCPGCRDPLGNSAGTGKVIEEWSNGVMVKKEQRHRFDGFAVLQYSGAPILQYSILSMIDDSILQEVSLQS